MKAWLCVSCNVASNLVFTTKSLSVLDIHRLLSKSLVKLRPCGLVDIFLKQINTHTWKWAKNTITSHFWQWDINDFLIQTSLNTAKSCFQHLFATFVWLNLGSESLLVLFSRFSLWINCFHSYVFCKWSEKRGNSEKSALKFIKCNVLFQTLDEAKEQTCNVWPCEARHCHLVANMYKDVAVLCIFFPPSFCNHIFMKMHLSWKYTCLSGQN